MNLNTENIHNSEQRLNYIIDITLRTRTLIIANKGYLNISEQEKQKLVDKTLQELKDSATALKIA